MKYLIVLAALAAVAYCDTKVIAILRQESDVSPDGSFSYSFESEDGIKQQQVGSLKSVPDSKEPVLSVDGVVVWPGPDNKPLQLEYTADHNGYQPRSDILPVPPTPPPTPPAILRALEWIAAHPQKDEPSARRP